MRRLEEEVRSLRETSLQQKMRLEAQALELDALAVAEKAGQAEAEGLRAALAGAEMVRKKLEEGSQRELQETKSLHQEQVSMGSRGFQGASLGGGGGGGRAMAAWKGNVGVLVLPGRQLFLGVM